MFSAVQIEALKASLSSASVKSREQGGRQVSYIEGWHVIAEANRIFGFDNWTRETVEMRMVAERERKVGKAQKDGWSVSYVARVKVIVFAGDSLVTREGVGAGHGIDIDLGQAHESAVKEAETDAMKRALMTFGNQFGLALYDKTLANVADEPDSYALYIAECKRHIAAETDAEVLLTWWNSDEQKRMRRDFQMDASDVNALKEYVIKRRAALAPKAA